MRIGGGDSPRALTQVEHTFHEDDLHPFRALILPASADDDREPRGRRSDVDENERAPVEVMDFRGHDWRGDDVLRELLAEVGAVELRSINKSTLCRWRPVLVRTDDDIPAGTAIGHCYEVFQEAKAVRGVAEVKGRLKVQFGMFGGQPKQLVELFARQATVNNHRRSHTTRLAIWGHLAARTAP